MFTAVFQDGGKELKKIVGILKEEFKDDDAVLIAKKDGIYLQSMDKAHVALIDLHLSADAASNYICDEIHYLGINFETWNNVFKSKSSKGVCTLSYKDTQPNTMQCVFQDNKKKSTFQLKLRAINDSEQNELVTNEFKYATDIILNSDDLSEILHDIAIVADDVVITRTAKRLCFHGVGDSANGKIEMEVDDGFVGQLSGIFSLKYLQWFAKASILCPEAVLSFDDEHPLCLQFKNDTVTLKFFVAGKADEHGTNRMDLDDDENA